MLRHVKVSGNLEIGDEWMQGSEVLVMAYNDGFHNGNAQFPPVFYRMQRDFYVETTSRMEHLPRLASCFRSTSFFYMSVIIDSTGLGHITPIT